MRRRSISIHAENAEEYREKLKKEENEIEECHRRKEATPSTRVVEDENDLENVPILKVDLEIEEKKKVEDEEQELIERLENLNSVYKINNSVEAVDKFQMENGINVLCSYFKENIRKRTDEREEDSTLVLFSSVKKPVLRAMSNNAIHDFDMKLALDTIIKEKENSDQEIKQMERKTNKKWRYSCYSTPTSSINKVVLAQNVECEDEVMKVMLIGSTHIGKTKLINNFFESRRNEYAPSSGLEIKKKIVDIINKKVRIEFFDTDSDFHLRETSRIYYKICDAFIYVVDCTKIDSFNYIKSVHSKIFDNSASTTFILVTLNKNFISKNLGKSIEDYCNEYKITLFPMISLDEFHMKNENVDHLFSAMLVKKLTRKRKSKFCKGGINSKRNSAICSSGICLATNDSESGFGFSDSYSIENYNAFNDEAIHTLPHPVKRRWSFYTFSSFK